MATSRNQPPADGGAEAQPATTTAVATPVDPAALLQDILENGKLVRGNDEAVRAKSRETATKLLGVFVKQLVENTETNAEKRDTIELVKRMIARIDATLSEKVDEVLHTESFRTLEASWRGLHYLVFNTETSTRLKLRLLDVDAKTLSNDLSRAADIDQSTLFKKVYEEEYGTYGGNPFSLLMADYFFGRLPEHTEFIRNLSKVAAAAHTPLITGAAPELFDMESFTELSNPRDLAKVFESTELAGWRSFRESEDSRYVTMTLPHFLLRLPYGDKTVKVEGFSMHENVTNDAIVEVVVPDANGNVPADTTPLLTTGRNAEAAKLLVKVDPDKTGKDREREAELAIMRAKERRPKDHKKYVWGNSAYALTQRITNAFAQYGWCAAIRGPEGGGVVSNLPLHTFETEEGDKAAKTPTELAITDRREKELDSLGFISLLHCKGTDKAAFFGGQTTHKPPVFDTDAANSNALISARLPYLLAASRFAHYLKVICRDKIGSFQTKDTMTQYLNRWIMGYVLGTDDAGQELKAQYPLREARVDVFDVPGKPGAYRAVVFLRPHFQLEELTASIRLVAELPPPAAA